MTQEEEYTIRSQLKWKRDGSDWVLTDRQIDLLSNFAAQGSHRHRERAAVRGGAATHARAY